MNSYRLKIHQCNKCGKAFTCASYIHRHERHCTEKVCSEYTQCSKAFTYHSHPKRHEKMYTGEELYKMYSM